jgi:hypothetical protein
MEAQMIPNYTGSQDTTFNLIPVTKGNVAGFVDRNNEVAIPPKYDAVSFFNSYGLAQVKKGGLYGLIDVKGSEIIPPFSSTIIGNRKATNKGDDLSNLAILSQIYYLNNPTTAKWMLFSPSKKNKTSAVYDAIQPRFDDRIEYDSRTSNDNYGFSFGFKKIVTPDAQVNFIDTNFQTMLPFNVINGFPLNANLFSIYNDQGLVGMCKKDGTMVLDYQYYSIKSTGHPDYFIITLRSNPSGVSYYGEVNYQGIINQQGKILLDTMPSTIHYLQHDHFLVSKQGVSGIINIKGETILPYEFSSLSKLTDALYVGRKQESYYMYDLQGQLIGGPYPKMTTNEKATMWTSIRNDSTLFIDRSGKIKFRLQGIYNINQSSKGGMIVSFESNQALISETGRVLIEPAKQTLTMTVIDDLVMVYTREGIRGVYSISKGWIHPADGSVQQTEYRNPDQKTRNNTLQVWTELESYTYTNTLKNVTVEIKSEPNKTYQTTTVESPDTLSVRISSGRKVKYPRNENLDAKSYGDEVYFEKKEDGQRIILNESLQPIQPPGFVYRSRTNCDGQIVFELNSKEKGSGLMSLQGKWLYGPDKELTVLRWLDGLWLLGSYNSMNLYTKSFQPISEKKYATVNSIDSSFITAKELNKTEIDIYSAQGKLLSTNTYSNFTYTTGKIVSLEKSKDGQLSACLADSLLHEIQCYPYATLFPLEGNHDLLIVKDLFDFGVINRNGNIIVPFLYKSVTYIPELKLFKIEKDKYLADLVTTSNKLVIGDIEGYMNKVSLSDDYVVFSGKGDTYVFNVHTLAHTRFKEELGSIRDNKAMAKHHLVVFDKNRTTTYADADTGQVYQLE